MTYTITVKNTGNVTVSDLELADELEGVTLSDLSATTLAPKETATATATYKVTQANVDEGQIINKVTATGKNPDGGDVSNFATETVTTEEKEASIEVTKTSEDSEVKVGDTVTYTITVKNTGNVTVSELGLEDILPGIQLGELDKKAIGPGETATATATYTVEQKDVDAGKIYNKVTATGKDPKNEDVINEGSCTVTTVEAKPELTVTKTSEDSGVAVDDTVTYTITVKNTGGR